MGVGADCGVTLSFMKTVRPVEAVLRKTGSWRGLSIRAALRFFSVFPEMISVSCIAEVAS